jgi:hypothetical protein
MTEFLHKLRETDWKNFHSTDFNLNKFSIFSEFLRAQDFCVFSWWKAFLKEDRVGMRSGILLYFFGKFPWLFQFFSRKIKRTLIFSEILINFWLFGKLLKKFGLIKKWVWGAFTKYVRI